MGSNYTKKPNNRSGNKKNNYKKKHYSYEINGNKQNRNIAKNKGKNKKNNSYSKNTREDFNKIEYHQIPLENNIEEKDNSINFIEDKIDNWLKENNDYVNHNDYINKEENQDETVNIDDGYNNNEITSEIELKKELPIEENYSFEEPILTKKVKTEENVTYNTPTKEEYTNQELKRLRPRFLYFLGPLLLVLLLLGTTYAFFTYYKEGEREADVAAGEVYVKLSSNTTPSINIDKAYPRTVSEARERNDNYVDFVILTKNTSSTTAVIYDLDLEDGEYQSGTRIDSEYLKFDLSLIGDNNSETLLMDAVDYETFNNNDLSALFNVPINTNQEVSTTYRLRMWISDEVIISDDDGTYTSDEFNELYANIGLKIDTTVTDTSLPLSVRANRSYIENSTTYLMTTITNEYLLEDVGESLQEDDTIRIEITNPANKVIFNYIDTKGNEETTGLSSIDKEYSFNKNEDITIKVFMKEEHDDNLETTIHFKVSKNGVVVKEYDQFVSILGTNYCLTNGFTKLADCLLVSEHFSDNVSNAKTFINSKGSPNVDQTAPVYSYIETEGGSSTISNPAYWVFTDSYQFNTSTGRYKLTNSNGQNYNNNNFKPLSDDFIGYYTTDAGIVDYRNAPWICMIETVDVENNSVTCKNKAAKIATSMDSEVGLYKVADNYGDSYIFRGNVQNNNVYFGGYYWKVVRINGDGSIRLIFNGNTLAADGNRNAGFATAISTSNASGVAYGYESAYTATTSLYGPTYIGYMYNEEDTPWVTEALNDSTFVSSSAYYWGESYTSYVDASGITRFQLVKGTNNYDFVTATLGAMKDDAEQLAKTPYTCKQTSSADATCTILYHVNSISSTTSANVNYVTVNPNSTDLSVVYANNKDNSAKKALDTWFENKFMIKTNNGNSVTTYLADNLFCNDRSIGSGSGYRLNTDTYYAAYSRLNSGSNKYATLMCNKNDAFTVDETSTTNGKLTYPIGLITADEVALAGGKYNESNVYFWLKSAQHTWTMTPAVLYSSSAVKNVFYINVDGILYRDSGNGLLSLRAVINLKGDVLIDSGDGTATNPYRIQ